MRSSGRYVLVSYLAYYCCVLLLLHCKTVSVNAWELKDQGWCLNQWRADRRKDALVTFITPSTARKTLSKTLLSLLNQTDPHWLSLVIFDGMLSSSLYLNTTTNLPIFLEEMPSKVLEDGRFCFAYLNRQRTSNCGAEARNLAVQKQVITPWTGFVDDDDTLMPRYTEYLQDYHSRYPHLGSVLFRMCFHDGTNPPKTLPNLVKGDIVMGQVGISFAIRTVLMKKGGFLFKSSNSEDLMYLTTLKLSGIPILLSPYVTYRVHDLQNDICYAEGSTTMYNDNSSAVSYLRDGGDFPAIHHGQSYECHRLYFEYQPRFKSPDSDNVGYIHQINGLQASIARTLARGCVHRWEVRIPAGKEVLDLAFSTATETTSWYVQMLNSFSSALSMSSPNDTSSQTRRRMNYALQLWNTDLAHEVRPMAGVQTAMYYIPSMLTLDLTSPRFRCHAYSSFLNFGQSQVPAVAVARSTPFTIYRDGYYVHCQVVDSKHATFVRVEASPCHNQQNTTTYCSKKTAKDFTNTICQDVMRPEKVNDVVMFGQIMFAEDNRREQLCDAFSKQGLQALCVQNVHGSLLNHFICSSIVVVMSKYANNVALETHHIDSLLQVHKVVVAERSSFHSDQLYQEVIATETKSHLPVLIKHIVADPHHWMKKHHYIKKVQSFIDTMTNNTDPLCFALGRLSENTKRRLTLPK